MDPKRREEAIGLARAARRRAALARERAERADATAERHELLAAQPGQEFHATIAMTHRRSAACHRSSARLQEAFALRTTEWAGGSGARPRFMASVAEAYGTSSAALTLVDSGRNQLAVAVSDERSDTAMDLEFVLGEGPARDAVSDRRLILESAPAIEARWPTYGPAITARGITSVAAVPLDTETSCIGALTVFCPHPGLTAPEHLTEIAGALTCIVLLGPDPDPELYGGTDHRDTMQQAVGVLSARTGHRVGDALALIKARAFTDDVSTEVIARRILRADPELTWE